MKVSIVPDLMNEEANFQVFNRIFPFFEEKKHWLCIDSEEVLVAMKNSLWLLIKDILITKIMMWQN